MNLTEAVNKIGEITQVKYVLLPKSNPPQAYLWLADHPTLNHGNVAYALGLVEETGNAYTPYKPKEKAVFFAGLTALDSSGRALFAGESGNFPNQIADKKTLNEVFPSANFTVIEDFRDLTSQG